MASQLDHLVVEIDRIIASPYAVSLKILDNIVRDCGVLVVQAWADLHSEKIRSLITIVLEGLQLWPYTLGLLGNLVAVPALRVVALLEAPTLLHDLLERADRSDQGFNEVSGLCIVLMSRRLPESTALPALAQSFFAKVFDMAVREPSIQTVEPVYILLRGACEELLEILPQDSLDDFRDHLTRMMRTVKSIDDQLLSLFCLATIARVNIQHIDPRTSLDSHDPDAWILRSAQRAPSAHTRDEVQKFYSGERASKTMHLLALQVIYACRGDHSISQTTTIKHVRLAREVACAVEPGARYAWAKGNPAIMRKLHEKVMQTPLYHAVQLEALCFISTLSDVQSIPLGSVVAYQEAIIKTHLLYIDEDSLGELLSLSLEYYVARLSDSFWASLLRTLLLAVIGSEEDHVQHHRALVVLLSQLQALCSRSPLARLGFVRAFYSDDIARVAGNITVSSKTVDSMTRGSILLREYELNLITLVLSTVLSQQTDARPQQDTALTLRLLERQRELANMPARLDHHLKRNHAATSIFERPCTQDERGISLQWREKLAAQLQTDALHRQECVVRFVDQLCRDLEERCEDIEGPLRQEKDSHDQTREQYRNLEGRIIGLEKQLDRKNDTIADLRRAKDSVENEFEIVQNEADLIKQKAQDFEHRLERATEEFKRELGEVGRRHESVKLEMQANLACRTEQMDDQEDEIKELRQQVEKMTKLQELANTVSEKQKSALEKDLEAARALVESNSLVAVQRAEEMAQTSVKVDELNRTIELMHAKTQQLEDSLGQAETEFSELEQTSRLRLEEQDKAHKKSIAQSEEQTRFLEQEREQKSLSFQVELGQINTLYEKKLASRDAKVQELRKRCQLLAAKSSEKSRELEEAHKMRSGLMSALGLNPAQGAHAGQSVSRVVPTMLSPSAGLERSQTIDNEESDGDEANLMASESEREQSPGGQPTSSPAFEPIMMKPKLRVSAFKQPTMRRKIHVGPDHEMLGGTDTIKKRRALRQSVPNISSPKRQGALKPPGWTSYLNNLEPDWDKEESISKHSPTKTPGPKRTGFREAEVGAGKENRVPATPHGPVGTYGTDLTMDDFDATTVEF